MTVGEILVVDDDAMNRKLLQHSLLNDGHAVRLATNGHEAVDELRQQAPDVVLLDIVMPIMDGIEVLEHMKADPELQHLPVLMISSVEDSASVVRCIEMGADDFLPKPFDPVILRARVRAGLTRKRLQDVERKHVHQVFSRFLPESIVDKLLARGGEAAIPAELLEATVLFADLRGFTTFAEAHEVDVVIGVLNRYLTLMSDAILDQGGTLVDYMGDGVMGAFGAPLPSTHHADQALEAARQMVGPQLQALNGWLGETGIAPFRMGVGLCSGPVVSGNVGSPRRLDYAVIGDTTNTASRIEDLTKATGYSVLLSETTRAALHVDPPDLVIVDEFEIRGRRHRIKVSGLVPSV
ncbi:MAG TPA: response regulator [Actinomycetes bacterium]